MLPCTQQCNHTHNVLCKRLLHSQYSDVKRRVHHRSTESATSKGDRASTPLKRHARDTHTAYIVSKLPASRPLVVSRQVQKRGLLKTPHSITAISLKCICHNQISDSPTALFTLLRESIKSQPHFVRLSSG